MFGKEPENQTVVDVTQMIRRVMESQQELADRQGISLELEGEHCVITGDEFALETLVSNLLSNASKYTPEGGNIKVKVFRNGDSIELEVEDDGPGVPENERDRIFDRFYHSEKNPDELTLPGCGLGLTIVSHVAELHKAKVSVGESSYEHGSVFRVSFPGKRL